MSTSAKLQVPPIHKSTGHQHGSHCSCPREDYLRFNTTSCILGQQKIEYVEAGRQNNLPIECLDFPISPHFTVQFWHLSKYFIAFADLQNNYLNTLFTRDIAPYRIYQKYDPCCLQLGFCIQCKWM